MIRLWSYRGWSVPFVALLLAELGLRHLDIDSQGLALPSEVIAAVGNIIASGVIFERTWETLLAIGLGLAVGGGLGVLGGIGLGLSSAASKITSIAIELFRPIPPVAVIPIALLVYGFGIKMEGAIIAFTCFWPMLLLTQAAVSSVEPRLIEVSSILELSPRKKVMSIILPAAAARIVTALRLTIGIAFIVAVTTEIAVNPFGLGHAMMISQMEMRPSFMYAYVS
jgi:ABC-type nitrate/sulfonate/bicarbonate transport system permease component